MLDIIKIFRHKVAKNVIILVKLALVIIFALHVKILQIEKKTIIIVNVKMDILIILNNVSYVVINVKIVLNLKINVNSVQMLIGQ